MKGAPCRAQQADPASLVCSPPRQITGQSCSRAQWCDEVLQLLLHARCALLFCVSRLGSWLRWSACFAPSRAEQICSSSAAGTLAHTHARAIRNTQVQAGAHAHARAHAPSPLLFALLVRLVCHASSRGPPGAPRSSRSRQHTRTHTDTHKSRRGRQRERHSDSRTVLSCVCTGWSVSSVVRTVSASSPPLPPPRRLVWSDSTRATTHCGRHHATSKRPQQRQQTEQDARTPGRPLVELASPSLRPFPFSP